MPYTVGIKRRFWFGYRKASVNGHDWQNGRFILNLADGSQEHIPGFSVPSLKVYSDFWTHLARIERSRPSEPVRQGATIRPAAPAHPLPDSRLNEEDIPLEIPTRETSPEMQEVKRRAALRVQEILENSH